MSNKLCIIYVETNDLHSDIEEIVIKKNLYCFARLVSLKYEIGYVENDEFISLKKVISIVKPRCMYITEESIKKHGITNEIAKKQGIEIEQILNTFIKDLKDVNIVISHNINFHFKTILAEYIRYNIKFSFTDFDIIDTINFYHKLDNPSLSNLYNYLFPNNDKPQDKIDIIKLCFLKLYDDYVKTC
jgi:DNA polymerase III epsilon subunit-like protein